MDAESDDGISEDQGARWLNRNVLAFSLTSFFSDFCHEMATAVLPQFMATIGLSASSLGSIEGIADALSSFAKVGVGFHSDRIGHRKKWAIFGYALTAISKSIFAFAFSWPLILAGRVLGWVGRGIRNPLRDAMLAESVGPESRGKAFGFHRAGDTLGAIVGPLTAFILLDILSKHPGGVNWIQRLVPVIRDAPGGQFRFIFLFTLLPGALSVASFGLLVREKRREKNHELHFLEAVRSMPKEYRSFLLAVGIFGIADFAPTLMILRATTLLEPRFGLVKVARLGAFLYLLRNTTYAGASFPIGAYSDRFPRGPYIAIGYALAVITFLGFAFAVSSIWWFVFFFAISGVFIAWEDTMEGVSVRDYVSDEIAGTAYGLLGLTDGIGDFVSSFMVGILWTSVGAMWGFLYAACMGTLGACLMVRVPAGVRGND